MISDIDPLPSMRMIVMSENSPANMKKGVQHMLGEMNSGGLGRFPRTPDTKFLLN
jgi:hypothetical protein